MKLSNRIYDVLKWVVMIVSPALCTLIVTLSSLWGWSIPTDAIVGTITAITTFIGVVIGISSAAYKKDGDFIE